MHMALCHFPVVYSLPWAKYRYMFIVWIITKSHKNLPLDLEAKGYFSWAYPGFRGMLSFARWQSELYRNVLVPNLSRTRVKIVDSLPHVISELQHVCWHFVTQCILSCCFLLWKYNSSFIPWAFPDVCAVNHSTCINWGFMAVLGAHISCLGFIRCFGEYVCLCVVLAVTISCQNIQHLLNSFWDLPN